MGAAIYVAANIHGMNIGLTKLRNAGYGCVGNVYPKLLKSLELEGYGKKKRKRTNQKPIGEKYNGKSKGSIRSKEDGSGRAH